MAQTEAQQQVFELIVRQALAGAPWRDMYSGVIAFNDITPREVELEVDSRRKNLEK